MGLTRPPPCYIVTVFPSQGNPSGVCRAGLLQKLSDALNPSGSFSYAIRPMC